MSCFLAELKLVDRDLTTGAERVQKDGLGSHEPRIEVV